MKSILCLSVLFFFSGCAIKGRYQEIPEFEFMNAYSGSIYNTKNIPFGKPFVVVYFKTDCRSCQQETTDWLTNMDRLNAVNFFFLTDDSSQRIKVFHDFFELNKYPNVVLGADFNKSFKRFYNPSMTPYVVLFDSERKERIIYPGGISARRLIVSIGEIDKK